MPDIIKESPADLSTDHAWEEWGRRDPYFGVITEPRFRLSGINELSKREFFESGSNHVDYVMQTIRRTIAPGFVPRTALDFGCGVGRTLIPLARMAQQVVGADVSASMLQEARRNCDAHQLANVKFVVSDDAVSSITGEFDLVHSFIVFQHIPLARGRLIFRNLLNRIAPAGVAAIHVLYSKIQYADTFGIAPVSISAAPPRQPLPQPVQPDNPEMQMNPYVMNELFFFMQAKGVQRFYSEFSDHGGELGLFIFFQMPEIPMIPFYERSLNERLTLTETAIREKRTLIERWAALENAESAPWSARAAMAADYLRGQPSVADFGCGTMILENQLQENQRYIPVDVVARDGRTLVCDLNRQPPPETGATAATFLGLLEYLYDPLSVLRQINRQYLILVVSYCINDAPNAPPNRREHAWVNDFSEADMLNIFSNAGWTPDEGRLVDNLQKMWRLTAKNPIGAVVRLEALATDSDEGHKRPDPSPPPQMR